MRKGWLKSGADRVEKILMDGEKEWLWISRYAARRYLLHSMHLFCCSQQLPDS